MKLKILPFLTIFDREFTTRLLKCNKKPGSAVLKKMLNFGIFSILSSRMRPTTLLQHLKVCRSSKNNSKINYITHLTPSSGAYFEYFWNLYDRCTRTGFPFCQLVDSFPFLSLNSALQLSAIAALDFVNFWSTDSSAVLLLPLRSQPPEPEKM